MRPCNQCKTPVGNDRVVCEKCELAALPESEFENGQPVEERKPWLLQLLNNAEPVFWVAFPAALAGFAIGCIIGYLMRFPQFGLQVALASCFLGGAIGAFFGWLDYRQRE